jgi:hypothetical protein
VSPWFEAVMSGGAGSTYELYMSTSQNGPWSRIHRGGSYDTWVVTGARYYKARSCTSSSCGAYSNVEFEQRRVCEPGDVPL